MKHLLLSSIISQVRTRLDELAATASDMLGNATDDRNLEATIENVCVEGISAVHLAAPSSLMEGNVIDSDSQAGGHKPAGIQISIDSNTGTMDINLKNLTAAVSVLRVVFFQCGDSDVALYAALPESGAYGKLQKNRYLRGDKFHPTLIEMHDSTMEAAHFKYYTTTLREASGNVIPNDAFSLTYYPKPEKIQVGQNYGYYISSKLELPVINYITGLVLQSYKLTDLAQTFFTRATDAMEQ